MKSNAYSIGTAHKAKKYTKIPATSRLPTQIFFFVTSYLKFSSIIYELSITVIYRTIRPKLGKRSSAESDYSSCFKFSFSRQNTFICLFMTTIKLKMLNSERPVAIRL